MEAEFIATGEEIISGGVIDDNSAYIAGQLTQAGITVTRHICIGDDPDTLSETLLDVGQRADIAVVTGGLGPTRDDLTTAGAAKAAGVEISYNRRAMASLENYLNRLNRPVSILNKKHACLP